MGEQPVPRADDSLNAYNYIAAFIDLLGQKDELSRFTKLPSMENEAEREAFFDVVRKTCGAVENAQKSCAEFFDSYAKQRPIVLVPANKIDVYENLRRTDIRFQRFSDGLVAFVSLGDMSIKVPMNGVFGLIAACGSMCVLQLAKKRPIRGGIELGWGVEMRKGELYGAVVSGAHTLEDEIAQYPRIVVGKELMVYLDVSARDTGRDEYSVVNRTIAEICFQMIAKDADGQFIIDYLGEGFKQHVAKTVDPKLFVMAYEFVLQQLEQWTKEGDGKLKNRYQTLKGYFDANSDLWLKG